MKTDKTLFDLRLRIQGLEDGPFEYDRSIDGEYAPFVEYEVRKRIEARGWSWIVESSTSHPKYHAALDEMGNASLEWRAADTPAAALLSAYIAALEVLSR